MRDRNRVFERMAQCIARALEVPLGAVVPDKSALDFDGWDSVTHTYVLLALEQEFGTEMPIERTLGAANLAELAAVIADALAKRGSV